VVVSRRRVVAVDDAALPPAALETIIAMVGTLRRPAGKGTVVKGLRGSQARGLKRFGILDSPHHGALRDHPAPVLEAGIEALLRAGRLAPKGKKYPTVWLPNRPVRAAASLTKPRRARPTASPLRRALERYCRQTARELGWKKAYMVLPKSVMIEIETHRPDSLWALRELRGIGETKLERFGPAILALVREHA